MQGILLQIGYFERGLSKSFKEVNFIIFSDRMSFVCHQYVHVCHSYVLICHAYVLVCHSYVTRMYLYAIRMSLVCTRMSSVCHSYIIRMSLLSTRMSSVCHSYVLVCHPYITHLLACYSYVLICHPYVTRMWFYHRVQILKQNIKGASPEIKKKQVNLHVKQFLWKTQHKKKFEPKQKSNHRLNFPQQNHTKNF